MTLRAYTGDDTLRMNHVRSRGGCYVLAGREGDDVYLAIRREDLPQGVQPITILDLLWSSS